MRHSKEEGVLNPQMGGFGLKFCLALALFPFVTWSQDLSRSGGLEALRETELYWHRQKQKGIKDVVWNQQKISLSKIEAMLRSLESLLLHNPSRITDQVSSACLVPLTDEEKKHRTTGYYEPKLPASDVPLKSLPYPILESISPDSPLNTKERGSWFENPPKEIFRILAYTDLISLHLAQLEGSALLQFQNGVTKRIIYQRDNGHEYKSPASELRPICKSVKPNRLFECYQEQRELVTRAILANPRYIFFRWDEESKGLQSYPKHPKGSSDIRLVPMRSVATDSKIPLGLPVLLEFRTEDLDYKKELVFVHDRGNSIQGLGHIDLYLGNGNGIDVVANRLQTESRAFLVLPNCPSFP